MNVPIQKYAWLGKNVHFCGLDLLTVSRKECWSFICEFEKDWVVLINTVLEITSELKCSK